MAKWDSGMVWALCARDNVIHPHVSDAMTPACGRNGSDCVSGSPSALDTASLVLVK